MLDKNKKEKSMIILSTLRALPAWIRYRRTLSALARLDDHMLRDIGISRSGIEHAAKIAVR